MRPLWPPLLVILIETQTNSHCDRHQFGAHFYPPPNDLTISIPIHTANKRQQLNCCSWLIMLSSADRITSASLNHHHYISHYRSTRHSTPPPPPDKHVCCVARLRTGNNHKSQMKFNAFVCAALVVISTAKVFRVAGDARGESWPTSSGQLLGDSVPSSVLRSDHQNTPPLIANKLEMCYKRFLPSALVNRNKWLLQETLLDDRRDDYVRIDGAPLRSSLARSQRKR